jgi:hypothetical protein
MTDGNKLPAKIATGDIALWTEQSGSLVARGMVDICRNIQVQKRYVPEQRADTIKEPYLFSVGLWFTVTTAKVLKHIAERNEQADLANRAAALEGTVPSWMSQPSTADERRMRWEMFDFAGRIMRRQEEGLAEMIAQELNKVAEQLNAEAQFDLGEAHHEGDGVSQSDGWAVYWWRKAAEQGCEAAQYQLGCAYAHGEGVPKDYVKAHMWFSLNLNWPLGVGPKIFYNPASDQQIEYLENVMTPAQIAEARSLAHEWAKSHAS